MNPETKKYIEDLNSKLIQAMALLGNQMAESADPVRKNYLQGKQHGLNDISNVLEAELDLAHGIEISNKQYRGIRR